MTIIFEVIEKYQLHILVQLVPMLVLLVFFFFWFSFIDEKTEAQIV